MKGRRKDGGRPEVFRFSDCCSTIVLTSILLSVTVLDDPAGYIAGGGKDNQIYLGAFLEFLLILANVGTAVVLYPIVRRQNKILALGYVAARTSSVFLAAGSSLCSAS